MAEKGFISKIYKHLIQTKIEKQTIQLKNWAEDLKRHVFPKKRYRWPVVYEKMVSITNHLVNVNQENHTEVSPHT